MDSTFISPKLQIPSSSNRFDDRREREDCEHSDQSPGQSPIYSSSVPTPTTNAFLGYERRSCLRRRDCSSLDDFMPMAGVQRLSAVSELEAEHEYADGSLGSNENCFDVIDEYNGYTEDAELGTDDRTDVGTAVTAVNSVSLFQQNIPTNGSRSRSSSIHSVHSVQATNGSRSLPKPIIETIDTVPMTQMLTAKSHPQMTLLQSEISTGSISPSRTVTLSMEDLERITPRGSRSVSWPQYGHQVKHILIKNIKHHVIAEQLTFMMHGIYQHIDFQSMNERGNSRRDLLNPKDRGSYFTDKYVEIFNQTVKWVQFSILGAGNCKERAVQIHSVLFICYFVIFVHPQNERISDL